MNVSLKPGCRPECPGCRHRGLSHGQSLISKEGFVKRVLGDFISRVEPIVHAGGDDIWAYRRKVCLYTRYHGSGWEFGLRRNDEIIPIPDCPVHAPLVNRVAAFMASHLPPPHILPVAFLHLAGDQVTLIVKSKPTSDHSWLTPAFREGFATHCQGGLWLHFHPSAGRKVFGKGGWVHLLGPESSRIGQHFMHGPSSFQQQVFTLYHHLIGEVKAFFEPLKGQNVVDLYSGIGVTAEVWSREDARVLGVELGDEEIRYARINAQRATFLRGPCHQRIPQINQWLEEKPEPTHLLFANPPRTGLGPEICQWITEHPPQKMAYLSCSPGSLNRDLRQLCTKTMQVERIIPCDFFPNTHHVECLALLSFQKET